MKSDGDGDRFGWERSRRTGMLFRIAQYHVSEMAVADPEWSDLSVGDCVLIGMYEVKVVHVPKART